jgi:hypothetical protein
MSLIQTLQKTGNSANFVFFSELQRGKHLSIRIDKWPRIFYLTSRKILPSTSNTVHSCGGTIKGDGRQQGMWPAECVRHFNDLYPFPGCPYSVSKIEKEGLKEHHYALCFSTTNGRPSLVSALLANRFLRLLLGRNLK